MIEENNFGQSVKNASAQCIFYTLPPAGIVLVQCERDFQQASVTDRKVQQ